MPRLLASPADIRTPGNFTVVPSQIAHHRRKSVLPINPGHSIQEQLRQRRADNAARNLATGHWQHRTVNAVPA